LTTVIDNFNAHLLEAFPDPVVLLNRAREVVFANQAAHEVLEANYNDRDLAQSFPVPDVLAAAEAVVNGEAIREVDISLSVPVPRNLKIRIVSIADAMAEGAVALMVFQDISSETLAEQMRQDFVANVSHELRSPIASLIGIIETLQGPAKDDPEGRERFLSIMGDESQRMARMIDDLLSLSRVETSERLRPQEQVNVIDLLELTRELLIGRAEERKMELVFDFAADISVLAGDHDELMEVFQNLIDNAIKYGREASSVRITTGLVEHIPEIGGAGIAVAIENKGDGIAPDQLPRLTERFYRVDKGRSRKLGGTGLGLAIVKHIVSHHRGHLSIKSTLGKGATFTVYLPL
jgi:two-component system, OmpR family, phosphate regulon sensor histidine kinase PhoR